MNSENVDASSSLGFALYEKSYYKDSVAQFQIALEIDPDFQDAKAGMAIVKRQMKINKAKIAALLTAISMIICISVISLSKYRHHLRLSRSKETLIEEEWDMARILSDSNTGEPKKYLTKNGDYKIIARGSGEYFIRCPHKDCRAELIWESLPNLWGLPPQVKPVRSAVKNSNVPVQRFANASWSPQNFFAAGHNIGHSPDIRPA